MALPEPLAELFSSRVRAAGAALLLSRPHLQFSLTDLSRRLGLPVSSLQHECYKLTRMGVLRDERVGNTRLYRPNLAWPSARAAHGTDGACFASASGPRRRAGRCSRSGTGLAVRRRFAAAEPVFLLLVGELSIEVIDGIFARSRVALDPIEGAERVELAYFRPRDWQLRVETQDPFATSLRGHRRLELFPPPTTNEKDIVSFLPA